MSNEPLEFYNLVSQLFEGQLDLGSRNTRRHHDIMYHHA
uniref:Uncharacterized protein n=1 Tax=Arundo donax TaxID=35708 RepID=A0A0A9H2V5_ARUDO